MRNIVFPILVLLLLVGGCLFESISLQKNVRTCTENLDVVLQKVEQQTASPDDTLAFSKSWERCKTRLHAYIPHTEIRDVDQWIAEATSYLRTENYDLAHAKLFVAREKIASIPDSFRTNFGNIF